jgi:hypothetical protein
MKGIRKKLAEARSKTAEFGGQPRSAHGKRDNFEKKNIDLAQAVGQIGK